MSPKGPGFSIILAGGKGTRMGSANRHKVCFEIDGKPAIVRALESYNACNVKQHVVIVGSLAGQVVETVGKQFDNAVFAYQAQQLGTANAVSVGIRALAAIDGDADVLVVAGDRLIENSVLERFFDFYYSNRLELALLTTPNAEDSSQGRVVLDGDGEPVAIVEKADIRQREVFRELRLAVADGGSFSAAELVEKMKTGLGTEKSGKLEKAFGDLWRLAAAGELCLDAGNIDDFAAEEMTKFVFPAAGGGTSTMTPAEVDSTPAVNTSVYLVKLSALRWALNSLTRNNAQQEEYLSDIMMILRAAGGFRLGMLKIDNPSYILGFNDPAELLTVEDHIKARSRDVVEAALPDGDSYRSIDAWLDEFRMFADGRDQGPLAEEMRRAYSEGMIPERVDNYIEILEAAKIKLGGGDHRVLLERSPGRLNVMGRHIDHQGGNCNLMTIGYENLMLIHPRNDDCIRISNLNPSFKEYEFSIGGMLHDLPWNDWVSLVNSDKVSKMLNAYRGEWIHYIKAAVLRLQKKFKHHKLRGMDILVSGNVPMGAGLSSSSSLVVGTADAVVAANRLETFPSQLVSLCGEGEWLVGTRGGSADHAAVKLGEKGRVVNVTFFDFAIQRVVKFPHNHAMVVCDSGIKAEKSANARDQFNHRIACYRIGLELIRAGFPQYRPLLEHLRDVNVHRLGIPLTWIYRILLHLPENATRDELRAMLPTVDLEPYFATHQAPADGLYPIRGVVFFGLSESERSRLYPKLLAAGMIDEIGRMMNRSHDGDRVSVIRGGKRVAYEAPVSNSHLLKLIADLESGLLDEVAAAQLQWQPGAYACSLPDIDAMVDLALEVDGVAGAQLAGAGLGGCMMVLVRSDAVEALKSRLEDGYYAPTGRTPNILTCRPVAGSGILLG